MAIRKKPHWAAKIDDLLVKMHLTQAGLAQRLSVSPMTVSRWVRGTHRPTAETFLKLAEIAGSPENLYFWEQAGLRGPNSPIPFFDASSIHTSLVTRLTAFKVVAGRRVASTLMESLPDGVVIPLLGAFAHGDGDHEMAQQSTLDGAKVERIVTAPVDWCINPENLIGLNLRGTSMSPLIEDGSVIIVDTSRKDQTALNRKIVVASHRDHGLRVAWLNRVGASDMLISENRQFAPSEITGKSPWSIVGEVIWWMTRPPQR